MIGLRLQDGRPRAGTGGLGWTARAVTPRSRAYATAGRGCMACDRPGTSPECACGSRGWHIVSDFGLPPTAPPTSELHAADTKTT